MRVYKRFESLFFGNDDIGLSVYYIYDVVERDASRPCFRRSLFAYYAKLTDLLQLQFRSGQSGFRALTTIQCATGRRYTTRAWSNKRKNKQRLNNYIQIKLVLAPFSHPLDSSVYVRHTVRRNYVIRNTDNDATTWQCGVVASWCRGIVVSWYHSFGFVKTRVRVIIGDRTVIHSLFRAHQHTRRCAQIKTFVYAYVHTLVNVYARAYTYIIFGRASKRVRCRSSTWSLTTSRSPHRVMVVVLPRESHEPHMRLRVKSMIRNLVKRGDE